MPKLREAQRVPFTTEELAALDISGLAELDALSRLEARKVQSQRRGDEYSSEHPAEPISDELKTNAVAERLGNKAGNCPSSWLHGSDEFGHRFAKELYCGSEWCSVCGQPDSVAHNRRFESLLPKAQQTKHLGLFVIEFPLASRDKPRHRKALENYGKLAVKVLTGNWEISGRRKRGEMLRRGEVAAIKAKYFSRGMRRWHYFGDILRELGKLGLRELFTAEAEPDILAPAVKSNVHLNCLVDAGFIARPWLNHIVSTLREAFNEPKLIVHYGYVTKPGRMVHLLKYTTRATFLDYTWDKWLAGQLFGFRNMRSWGKWDEPAVWSLPEAEISEAEADKMLKRRALGGAEDGKSRCYHDGALIKWEKKPRPISELREMQNRSSIEGTSVIELGSGYYELPQVKPPAERIAESVPLSWQREALNLLRDYERKAEYEAWVASIHAGAELERKAEADYKAYIAERCCPPISRELPLERQNKLKATEALGGEERTYCQMTISYLPLR